MAKTNIVLKHIYLCDLYLLYGNIPFIDYGTHINNTVKKAYIEKLKIEYNQQTKKYTGDIDVIWDYFKTKYPKKLEKLKIDSYHQLVYRAMNHYD